jgi:hypothetical protein
MLFSRELHIRTELAGPLNPSGMRCECGNESPFLSWILEPYLSRLHHLSEILDPHLSPVVDLPRLRKLCSHGMFCRFG